MKLIIQGLIDELKQYISTSSEYGVGYLDSLQDICDKYNIKYSRTGTDLILESED